MLRMANFSDKASQRRQRPDRRIKPETHRTRSDFECLQMTCMEETVFILLSSKVVFPSWNNYNLLKVAVSHYSTMINVII